MREAGVTGRPGIPPPRLSARRTAFSRTPLCRSCRAATRSVGSSASSASRVHSAWMRATSRGLSRASLRSRGIALRSRRSSSSRCAVSRHHALGCSSVRVSSATVIRPRSIARAVPLPAAGNHPINPAALFPRLEVEQRPALFRDVLRVVDDLAVHVDDVERAIGTVGGEDRPEPGVARGEKVAAAPRRLRGERHAIRRSAPASGPGSARIRR